MTGDPISTLKTVSRHFNRVYNRRCCWMHFLSGSEIDLSIFFGHILCHMCIVLAHILPLFDRKGLLLISYYRLLIKNYMRCYDFYGSGGRGGTLLPVFRPYRMSTITTSSDQWFVNLHSDLNHISISTETKEEEHPRRTPSFKYLLIQKKTN